MNFIYKTKPWRHQEEALKYLYTRDSAALYTDMGTGKTKIMIDLIQNREFHITLIVGTTKSCPVWEEQIKIHGFKDKITSVNLNGVPTKNKIQTLKNAIDSSKNDKIPCLVVIVNYEGIWRKPFSDFISSNKIKLDCIICDESHRIKSPSSNCSSFLRKTGRRVQHRYLVTGTPLAETPVDIYAQYVFLDPSIFGTNLQNFKVVYENPDPFMSAKIGRVILDRKNPYKNLDDLREKMFSCAFYSESSLKLPKQRNLTYRFKLNQKCSNLYREMEKEGVVIVNDKAVVSESVLTNILKLQQITSGYVPIDLKHQENPTDVKTINISKDRIEALETIIESLPKTEPLVIFAVYKKDLKNIRVLCNTLGIPYSEVSGSSDTLLDWKAGKTQVLGVQYSSGSESIDLTRSRYCVYYSMTRRLSLYLQSKKRIHRPNQTRNVTYYHLIAETYDGGSTIDRTAYEALKSKKDVIDYIMEKGEF